jgi:1,4-dihydroxy-2-naphthoyl-CoA synthase
MNFMPVQKHNIAGFYMVDVAADKVIQLTINYKIYFMPAVVVAVAHGIAAIGYEVGYNKPATPACSSSCC